MLPWTALSLALSLRLALARSGAERGECGRRRAGLQLGRRPYPPLPERGSLPPSRHRGVEAAAGHPTHLRWAGPGAPGC